MTPDTFAFLVGILVGNIFLPALLYRLRRGGRWDGWLDARRSSPSPGQFVFLHDPAHHTVSLYQFAGDANARVATELYWRAAPRPPLLFRRPP